MDRCIRIHLLKVQIDKNTRVFFGMNTNIRGLGTQADSDFFFVFLSFIQRNFFFLPTNFAQIAVFAESRIN